MPLNNVRNYLQERYTHLRQEWRNYARSDYLTALPSSTANDELLRRNFSRARNRTSETTATAEYIHNEQQTYNSFVQRDAEKKEPFEYFDFLSTDKVPINRLPVKGIELLPFKYHETNPVHATESVPETGFQLHPLIKYLIYTKYPRYKQYTRQLIRPLGTTDATFSDFNREQIPIEPPNEERKQQCLELVKHFLNATPFLPLHFVDCQYAKLPLSTGTGYHNRHSYKIRAHATYAHHPDYRLKPTSKGYFINSYLEMARTIVHRIKEFGLPFDPTTLTAATILNKTKQFFLEYPTIMFTRNHISDRDKNLKQRPVYAVDELFLHLETMLTFPLMTMARTMDCCIMYGLETIRGGNQFLDWLAKFYKSFFTIDWSHFDQSVPRVITDLYFTDFLESLIVINHGYQPTYEYPSYPDLTPNDMFNRVTNLLHFLHTWYNNMVYLTADGYAYLRTHAGVPSGLLNTQYIDSFVNLYLMIDGMLEFGFSDQEIRNVTLFIMGDDNSGFTNWQIGLLHKFITWFESYAQHRWNMTLSRSKSIITMMRNKIETLSYTCNFGTPIRPLPKLVSQLCYPEHGPKDKYMSARAIGIAYAAAGMDCTFHRFCEDVYHTFLPYAAPLTSDTIQTIVKHLPGQFKMLDAYTEVIDLTHFPTLHEVRNKYRKWDGPLDYAPKWNFAHFKNAPNVIPQDAITVEMFRKQHSRPRDPVIKIL